MPLPKYYCDYCDRWFNDTIATRKKHFESKPHKLAVKFWYDSLKAPSHNVVEESKKPPCQNLLKTGFCQFGSNCRFSHLIQFFGGSKDYQGISHDALPPSMKPPPDGGYNKEDLWKATWG